MLIDHAAHSFLSFWQLNHNYFSIIYFLSQLYQSLAYIFCFFSLLLLLVVFFNFKVTQAWMLKDSIIFPEITLFSQRSAPFAPEASAAPVQSSLDPSSVLPSIQVFKVPLPSNSSPSSGVWVPAVQGPFSVKLSSFNNLFPLFPQVQGVVAVSCSFYFNIPHNPLY